MDLVLADLGVSSMQLDNPARGFTYKHAGPLDMRMNPARGEPASQLLTRVSESQLADLLAENADEPHAAIIAGLLKQQPVLTTHAFDRVVRLGLAAAVPGLDKADVKMSVRRSLQALRIAVNDEFSALDGLLRALPRCLAAGRPGRHHHLPLGRGSAGEEGVPGRPAQRDLHGHRRSRRPLGHGGDPRQPAGLVGKAALGRARTVLAGPAFSLPLSARPASRGGDTVRLATNPDRRPLSTRPRHHWR